MTSQPQAALSHIAVGAIGDGEGAGAVVTTSNQAQSPALSAGLAALGYTAEPGSVARVLLDGTVHTVVGVTPRADDDELIEAAATGVRANAGVEHVAVRVEAPLDRLYIASVLATHAFTAYQSARPARTQRVSVVAPSPDTARLDSMIDAIRLTRDLVTLPAADTTPAALAELLRTAAVDAGAEVTVYDSTALEDLRMHGLLAVGRGSSYPPVLVRLHARGTGDRTLAVVGKGLTYDAGGVNLKLQMLDQMKFDMAGGAAAAAAVLHAARHPGEVSITAWIPLAENVMSGDSYRGGDVIRMRSGLTVEVQNTDAEGRLVLADAMDLALEENPDQLVSIATLTGNAFLSLGMRTAGLMGPSAPLREAILRAAETSGESIWPMPRLPYLAKKLRSQVADIGNLGEANAQMLIASLFLERFAGETPYAHLDIAGPAYNHGEPYAHVGHGGTGFGVRTLVELLG